MVKLAGLTLEQIVAAAMADGAGAYDGDVTSLENLPTRFPVQVDQQTRIFLEVHSRALGSSISALSGLILNQVVAHTLASHMDKHPSEQGNTQ